METLSTQPIQRSWSSDESMCYQSVLPSKGEFSENEASGDTRSTFRKTPMMSSNQSCHRPFTPPASALHSYLHCNVKLTKWKEEDINDSTGEPAGQAQMKEIQGGDKTVILRFVFESIHCFLNS
ncbi:hypothetical protein E2C01_030243 [Portunus trituberculatus]|uniref:Uncharacterized protein n=1 Tax=Portunus trituberculatus TaxID=210409 RepID=A0A5B7EWS2_PORTR|nr:hypothetical protein [Portunus trituberculatus]